MGGQGATGVGQNEWEHGRQVQAASGCLAHVKHERGRGREPGQLQFDMLLPPRMLIPFTHILSRLTPRLTRRPRPSLSPHPTSHGLARRPAADTCTSRAQTNRAGVHAGERVGDWPDGGAREWVGMQACQRTKPAEVWADERVGRPADRMDR